MSLLRSETPRGVSRPCGSSEVHGMAYTPVKTVTITTSSTAGFSNCSGCPGYVIFTAQATQHTNWHAANGVDPVVTPPPVVFDQVTNLKAAVTAAGEVTVTWTNPTPAPSSITVGRDGSDTGGAGAWSGSIAGSSTSNVFDKLVAGTKYMFSVTPAGGKAATVTCTTPAASTGGGGPVVTPPSTGSDVASFVTSQPVGPGSGFTLALADDFTGTSLDTSKWYPHRPDGSGDGEKGWGSEWFHSSQVSVANSVCRLTMVNDTSKSGSYQKSGCISTGNGHYQATPGTYVEARISFPNATSVWPAFWMFGPGWPPEFDIIEMGIPPVSGSPAMGDTGDHLVATWHGAPSGGSNGAKGGGSWGTTGLRGSFHTYGCLWAKDGTTYSVFLDGKLQKTVTGCTPAAKTMHLVFSHQAQYQGKVNPSPCYYDIDWVRAWQLA